MNRYRFGFIGVGVMAGAILERLLKNISLFPKAAQSVLVYDLDQAKTTQLKNDYNVAVANDEAEVFSLADIVVLGVKPQFYGDILAKIDTFGCKCVVSIMAGVKIATLARSTTKEMGIVRAMPNMPAKVGLGVTALNFFQVSDAEKQDVLTLFSCAGETVMVDEDKFDAVTSISGSGPAYVYLFADAMVKGGMNGGLTKEESRKLALQTIRGAAELAILSSAELTTLVDNVCSKGGTTIEAIDSFRQNGLEQIVANGIDACRKKSQTLSEKF